MRRTLAVFAFFLAVSAAFSWPTARLDPDVLVTRHFDLFPSVWVLEHPSGSAQPFGETLARVDSYVLLALGWLDPGLGGRRIAALVAWIGPALGALAAERCARNAFGVPRPHSLVAGLMYGFSGITATALLEGHVHHVLDPWLPLLLEAAWTTTPESPRTRPLMASVWWALALYTTAYAGVLGAALLFLVAMRGPFVRLLPGFFLVALPAGLVYLELFARGGRWSDGTPPQPDLVWRMGAATLAGIGGWSDAFDIAHHSISAPAGWMGLFLFLAAPLALRRTHEWRMLWFVAGAALVLTMGRNTLIGEWIAGLPGVQWFRFPVRFAWLWALCGGMVAARVAAAWAPGAWAWGLLAMLVGDAIVGTGLPWRLGTQIAGVPSAYASAPEGRAVLDLFPPAVDRSSGELEMWARALGCYYQATHRRPILEVCIGTDVDSPRERVAQWAGQALLAGQPVYARLADLGVGAIAVHADLFSPTDLAAVAAALGPPAADSRDGGEHVLLYVVPPTDRPDPAAAWKLVSSTPLR